MSLSAEITDTIELMYETGWTDGLPVVPPTKEKVNEFIESSGRSSGELIALARFGSLVDSIFH